MGGGVAPTERNVFLGKNFPHYPTIKKSTQLLPNFKYQLKNNYPPWATLQKDTIQLSHMSFTTSVTRV
jgi:hypothetical protein